MKYQFTVGYPPTANLYWRTVARMTPRGPRAFTYVSDRAKKFKSEVKEVARREGIEVLHGNIALRLDVYRPRRIGDLDNSLKVLIDAMREVAFDDDKQVIAIMARRFEDKDNPRVEVTVEELSES